MVMVTHEARAAASADRILFLADGEIVKDSRRSEEEILDTIRDVTLRSGSRSEGSRGRSSAPR